MIERLKECQSSATTNKDVDIPSHSKTLVHKEI